MTKFSTLLRGKSLLRVATLALALAASLRSSETRAQCYDPSTPDSLTNAGTEFLLAFEQNEEDGLVTDSVYQEIYIASLGDSATVDITTLASSTFRRTFILGPRQQAIYRIPRTLDVLINTSELVEDRIVKVSATSPIVCYGLNHKLYTADAFLALPRSTAGLEFRVMSYRNSLTGGIGDVQRPSQFAVAAFEDNTQVTIIPNAATRGGKNAQQPFTVTLNAAQGIQVQASPLVMGLDLTSTIVRSDKPVTVYGSHVRTEIPAFDPNDPKGISRDHLTEAIPPVNTWGRRFVIADYPFPGTTFPDLFRVLALNANTRVLVNGQPWRTLGENQYADSMYKGNITIEADGPVLVGTFAHSTQDPNLGQNELGDPFFVIVPPVDQTYNEFTFVNSTDDSYQQHFALVVTEITGKDRITLDGTQQPAIIFRDVPAFTDGSQYAVARIGIDRGFHTIKTLNNFDKGILLTTYGFGFVDSYGYTAGALFRPRIGIVRVDPSHSGPISERKNELIIRNVTNEIIFFDSAQVILHGEAAKKYKVKLKENLIFNIREIKKGQELKLHFTVEPPLEEQITGTLRFRTHTPKWYQMDASTAEFTLNPEAVADVQDPASAFGDVSLSHDASGTLANISVATTEPTAVTVRVFDATGRQALSVAEGLVVTGTEKFVINKHLFASGFYFVEVSSNKGPAVRRSFTVTK
jgi:hypothetical protein